jgi:hypothetical protein
VSEEFVKPSVFRSGMFVSMAPAIPSSTNEKLKMKKFQCFQTTTDCGNGNQTKGQEWRRMLEAGV